MHCVSLNTNHYLREKADSRCPKVMEAALNELKMRVYTCTFKLLFYHNIALLPLYMPIEKYALHFMTKLACLFYPNKIVKLNNIVVIVTIFSSLTTSF